MKACRVDTVADPSNLARRNSYFVGQPLLELARQRDEVVHQGCERATYEPILEACSVRVESVPPVFAVNTPWCTCQRGDELAIEGTIVPRVHDVRSKLS